MTGRRRMSSEKLKKDVQKDSGEIARNPVESKKSLDKMLAMQFSDVEYESVPIEMEVEAAKSESRPLHEPIGTINVTMKSKQPQTNISKLVSSVEKPFNVETTDIENMGKKNPEPGVINLMRAPEANRIKVSSSGKNKPVIKDAGQEVRDNNISYQNVNMSNVAIIYSEKHTNHSSVKLGMVSPERPERLVEAMVYLKKNKIFDNSRCDLVTEFDEATEESLLNVHTHDYVEFIKSYAAKGGGFLGDSTYITPESYDLARLAAGGAIKAADLVLSGDYSYAFALIRPPGHHASADKYGGFCLFNNAAVLARYLQKEKNINKVLILDWDAHAGNGTMDIFYSDPTVMTISIHRDPHEFYPRTGFITQTGSEAGRGYNVDIEMPADCGDEEYKLAFDEVILPLIERFSPNFVICCCGFDGHYKEHNMGLKLTSEGYYQMVIGVSSVVHGNLVLLSEGGYHKFNGQLSHSVINALLGKPNPIDDLLPMSNFERNTHKKIFKEAEHKISEVKKLFSIT